MQQGSVYVIYSYGPHWPLMVYDNDAHCWFTNDDNYSRTTSRHVSHIERPPGGVHARSVAHLIRLIGAGGVVEAVSDRLALAA